MENIDSVLDNYDLDKDDNDSNVNNEEEQEVKETQEITSKNKSQKKKCW